MFNYVKEHISVKVALITNAVLLLVMIVGTGILVLEQSKSLEMQLLDKGKMLSIIGAKIVSKVIEEAVDNGVITVNDAFDTNYEVIHGFDPPKYHTKYDFYLDKVLLALEDEFLVDQDVIFAVAVDVNGYLPTHNSRFQQPITGNVQTDMVGNRTKRMFNDPVGIAAAKNKEKGFLQVYHRDTGETMWDISCPVFVKGKQWGGFRIGFSLKEVESAKSRLMIMLISIMSGILVLSIVLIFFTVNKMLKPLNDLTKITEQLSSGTAGNIDEKIEVTSDDEIGHLSMAIEKLRVSVVLAMQRLKKERDSRKG
ncbi:MAG: HAMP domain-containing protein [Deltaproteobacteria bacterium]|nr:HAMP domain-containing protein [Deltaproteobacteria bacterium]